VSPDQKAFAIIESILTMPGETENEDRIRIASILKVRLALIMMEHHPTLIRSQGGRGNNPKLVREHAAAIKAFSLQRAQSTARKIFHTRFRSKHAIVCKDNAIAAKVALLATSEDKAS
jgi:hypothetical protein